VTIVKILHSVDDTVMTSKMILKEMKKNLKDIFLSKTGFQVISSLFLPSHNILNTWEKAEDIKFTTSKKSSEQRLNELCETFVGDIVGLYKELDKNLV